MVIEDICCCCLVNCCFKDTNQVYELNGKLESYGEMLYNTFNVSLRRTAICERCIVKLRDAAEFKQQIVESDLTLIAQSHQLADEDEEITEVEIKIEETNETFPQEEISEVKSEFKETNRALAQEEQLQNDDVGSMDIADGEGCTKKKNTKRKNKEKKRKRTNQSLPQEDMVQNDDVGSMEIADCEECSEKKNAKRNIKEKKEKCIKKVRRELKGSIKNTAQLISNSNLCIFKPFQNNTEYACYLCKEICTNIKSLREHSKTHRLSEFLTKICTLRGMSSRHVDISNLSCICAHACEDLDALTTHLTEKHDIQFQNDGHILIPYKLENGYECVICKKEFNTFYGLTIHMNCHSTNNVCDICGSAYFSRQYLRQHVKAKHKENSCSRCLSKFSTASELAQHTRKVHKKISKREFQCKICNSVFNYKYKLKNHMVISHGMPDLKLNCSICGKVFKNELNLRTHKRSVHDKERRFQCNLCDLRFFTRFDKIRHEKTHLDKCLYSCDSCEIKFKSKDSLRRHMKKQHAVSVSNILSSG